MVNWAVPYEHTVPFGHFFGVREVALWLTGQFHTDTQFHTNTQFYTDTHWCERGGFVVNWAVPFFLMFCLGKGRCNERQLPAVAFYSKRRQV